MAESHLHGVELPQGRRMDRLLPILDLGSWQLDQVQENRALLLVYQIMFVVMLFFLHRADLSY